MTYTPPPSPPSDHSFFVEPPRSVKPRRTPLAAFATRTHRTAPSPYPVLVDGSTPPTISVTRRPPVDTTSTALSMTTRERMMSLPQTLPPDA